ncbi:MAG: hypothetical protein A2838_03220 [Candidatus Zambryskibacteria bacterium RIFCSPHIGHO2_01_FULL_46_25]|uniref:Uncharacterized protein n=1 Tax=Candidatus Zambryskibacteria bacterium RIFCSPHIGHO2_01_FULL_46_25 TaxID=1802738 RepID=A0A1G2T0D0_9BACT|nr:MAG: hypothetical protein A2838_03220 [Candidatus Zambryskibacteria bacterium RIFCSPHIGHO2_01_FULL_46_25]
MSATVVASMPPHEDVLENGDSSVEVPYADIGALDGAESSEPRVFVRRYGLDRGLFDRIWSHKLLAGARAHRQEEVFTLALY